MEKQIILEEIKRISEIMNVKIKMNLFEQPQELSKFLEGGTKVGARSMDEFIDKLSTSGLRQADLIANSFKELITKDVLSQTEREFASNVIRDVFPELIETNIIDFLDKLPKDGSDKLLKFFKSNKTLQQKVVGLQKLGYKNANELTAQVWTDVLTDRPIVIIIPTPTPHVNPTPGVLSDEELLESFLNSTDEEVIQQVEANLEDTILKLVSEKKINLGGVNSSDVAEEISKSIDYQGKADIAQIKRVFDRLTPSQQINKANKAIELLQAALDKKGKSGVSRWIGKKWKGIDKSNPTKFVTTFLKFYGWCMIIMAIYGVYDLLYDKSIDWTNWREVIKGKLLGILKGPFGIIEAIIGSDDNPTPTPSGQYTDTLDSFKQFLRDKNNQNADSATYDSTTGIYYVNGVDYEFDSATKTFK